jgi:hypothetical protein
MAEYAYSHPNKTLCGAAVLRPHQRLVYAPAYGILDRHVEDPVRPVAGGVNLWGESPLCVKIHSERITRYYGSPGAGQAKTTY